MLSACHTTGWRLTFVILGPFSRPWRLETMNFGGCLASTGGHSLFRTSKQPQHARRSGIFSGYSWVMRHNYWILMGDPDVYHENHLSICCIAGAELHCLSFRTMKNHENLDSLVEASALWVPQLSGWLQEEVAGRLSNVVRNTQRRSLAMENPWEKMGKMEF